VKTVTVSPRPVTSETLVSVATSPVASGPRRLRPSAGPHRFYAWRGAWSGNANAVISRTSMNLKGVSELAMLHLGRRYLHQAPSIRFTKHTGLMGPYAVVGHGRPRRHRRTARSFAGLDAVVSKKRQLLLDFLRRLLTKFHILCRRVLVFWAAEKIAAHELLSNRRPRLAGRALRRRPRRDGGLS
jgi:hypothetical protein